MFTSERLLLPCAVGNQLLRTGETPFVPSAVPLQAEQSASRAPAPPAGRMAPVHRSEAEPKERLLFFLLLFSFHYCFLIVYKKKIIIIKQLGIKGTWMGLFDDNSADIV